jgi:CHASE3 domain sensor protein
MTAARAFPELTARLKRHFATRPMGMELLCVALVLLCSAALLLGLNIVDLNRQVDQDRQADKIIEQLDRTTNHLLGIEVAVRGYGLFGNPALVQRYRSESVKLAQAMATLGRLVSGMPDRASQMERIRRTVGVRAKAVAQVMQVAPDPPINIGLALRNTKDRGAIDAARNAIASMRMAEERRREQLATETAQAALRNFVLAAGIVLVSVLVGALGLSFALFGARTTPHNANPLTSS